jgi:hypothetical protein
VHLGHLRDSALRVVGELDPVAVGLLVVVEPEAHLVARSRRRLDEVMPDAGLVEVVVAAVAVPDEPAVVALLRTKSLPDTRNTWLDPSAVCTDTRPHVSLG